MSSSNNWQAMADALEPAIKDAVAAVAAAGKTHIQEHITANGQIDTGFMLSSVYASTPIGTDYKGGEKALPEAKPEGDTEAIIGVAASYGIFQNYGTFRLPPRPFWEPGLDETQADLDREMANISKALGKTGT